MNEPVDPVLPHPPLAWVEPHAGLLIAPSPGQLLYKMMTVENLLRSITASYLHFNRVDYYRDFPGADKRDGQQLDLDRPGNQSATFEKAPSFSAATYYDQSRSRTYACCFSLENSPFIWTNYANGSVHGKVCVVFDFAKLREVVNRTVNPQGSMLLAHGVQCHQIFSINYGVVRYAAWERERLNGARLPNPIEYTYLKDTEYQDERELRVSLSALGIGQFKLDNGSPLEFPPHLELSFDFRGAFTNGVIKEIVCAPGHDYTYLHDELEKLRIKATCDSVGG